MSSNLILCIVIVQAVLTTFLAYHWTDRVNLSLWLGSALIMPPLPLLILLWKKWNWRTER